MGYIQNSGLGESAEAPRTSSRRREGRINEAGGEELFNPYRLKSSHSPIQLTSVWGERHSVSQLANPEEHCKLKGTGNGGNDGANNKFTCQFP